MNLGHQHVSMAASVGMVNVAKLGGFHLPVVIITYCTWKMRTSLQEFQIPPQNTKERKKALLDGPYVCSGVHCVFHPLYHFDFSFFMMARYVFQTTPSLRAHYVFTLLCVLQT